MAAAGREGFRYLETSIRCKACRASNVGAVMVAPPGRVQRRETGGARGAACRTCIHDGIPRVSADTVRGELAG